MGLDQLSIQNIEAVGPNNEVESGGGNKRVGPLLKAEATLNHPHYKGWTPDGGAKRKNDVDELSLRKELQKMGAPSTVLGEESQEYQALAVGFPKKKSRSTVAPIAPPYTCLPAANT